jgi:hypothetical protein
MNRFKKKSSTLPPRAQELEPHPATSPPEKMAKPTVLNRLRDIVTVRKREKDVAAPTTTVTTSAMANTVTESLLDSSISKL